MLKTFFFLFVTLSLISCGKSGGGSSSSQGDAVSTQDIATNRPVPQAALNFEVNVKLANFNSTQEDKILRASDLIRKVVGSEEFKNAILNHTYNGKKSFVDNGGFTNAQIYKAIIEGSEKLRPGVDNQMDLELEVFSRSDTTVGYTFPNVIKIWMNSKFLNKYSAADVTANMMHEWLHKLGFGHAFKNTANRKYSVPYAVGYLVARIAKKVS